MASCCENNCTIEKLRGRQRGTLKAVLVVNTVMFVIIAGAAFYGKSTALLSDSLDNLGDALTYGLSLYAVSQGATAKAGVALLKGGLIFIGACGVLAQIILRLSVPELPSYEVMGIFSLVGLAANSLCLFLLWKHRNEDINMSSVWECSRNDIASNLSVFIAAVAVGFFESGWPDILVAACLVILLLNSSFRVMGSALKEWRGQL
ncbi:MAG: cation transporter [Methylovulum sp.]|uniref:cation transporter n=1 Tax=Methylovulum sp. TaxID=1916980 RepID=UPI0026156D1F|nr:cation transporter [Methylovulum sp.]MDD2722866.1 cation transporter [Methylovulum sp.]